MNLICAFNIEFLKQVLKAVVSHFVNHHLFRGAIHKPGMIVWDLDVLFVVEERSWLEFDVASIVVWELQWFPHVAIDA